MVSILERFHCISFLYLLGCCLFNVVAMATANVSGVSGRLNLSVVVTVTTVSDHEGE